MEGKGEKNPSTSVSGLIGDRLVLQGAGAQSETDGCFLIQAAEEAPPGKGVL